MTITRPFLAGGDFGPGVDTCDAVAGLFAAWFGALWHESGRSQDNRANIKAVHERRERAGSGGAAESEPARRVGGRVTMADAVF